MFELEKVDVKISGQSLLKEITLKIRSGEVCVIIGPNGAGKSTLLNLLCGDIKPSRGLISFNSLPMNVWRQVDFARRCAVLPQHWNLDFSFTSYDVVSMGRLPHSSEVAINRKTIDHVLNLCDCQTINRRPFTTLSGGEQQRGASARALESSFTCALR